MGRLSACKEIDPRPFSMSLNRKLVLWAKIDKTFKRINETKVAALGVLIMGLAMIGAITVFSLIFETTVRR